ncbi:gamma carbonic anhydrase family protein [bacterium]|nr:gamma carbonic anhydrase family protein [bacterium]
MSSSFFNSLVDKVQKAPNVFVAPGAQLVGDIMLHSGVSVWFNAVLRADYSSIEIGEGSNIQDGCIIHVDPGKPCRIGKNCVLGHAAIAHGCAIGDNTLIGMRATIMNNAIIGKNCIIGSHALITEGKEIPDNSLVMGMPGQVVRELTKIEIERITDNALRYQELAQKYLG